MKKFTFVLLAFMALVGCSKKTNSTDVEPQDQQTKIPISITSGVWSRVTDTDYESGNTVGVYITNYNGTTASALKSTGNHADNVAFTLNNNVWASATDLYWKDKNTNADFYCYFPHATVSNVNSHSFAVQADQSTESGYKASEFLWGKVTNAEPTEEAVAILTDRLMSSIIITLKPGAGYTDADFAALDKEVAVQNTKTSASINLATGVATATGSTEIIKPQLVETNKYRVIVVPQSVTDAALVKVTIDGLDYLLTVTKEFVANTQHTCSVTIAKTSNGVNVGIGGWETDDNDFGGSAE